MEIKLGKKPTYIYKNGRVSIKCTVNGNAHRIFMTIEEYMEFVADQVNALTHHITGKTNPRIT